MLDFNISEDELPIFLAEADEQLQSLDEILINLEKTGGGDLEQLQTAFRAAHTLKGMAGMINHGRMVDVTHAMETVFDGLRKNSIEVTSDVIDTCLDAVDALRLLREEVESSIPSEIEIEILVDKINLLVNHGRIDVLANNLGSTNPVSLPLPPENNLSGKVEVDFTDDVLSVCAEISSNSVASAARAFQLWMALQDMGEVLSMDPPESIIETAVPVHHFSALLKTTLDAQTVVKRLDIISEIDELKVDGYKKAISHQDMVCASNGLEQPNAQKVQEEPKQLGDFLVEKLIITKSQLTSALQYQKEHKDIRLLLGQIIVHLGFISQTDLDKAVIQLIQEHRNVGTISRGGNESKRNGVSETTVRTNVEQINNLMNLVGELITDRNHLFQLRSRLGIETHNHEYVEEFSETVTHLGRITDQLQEEVLGIRMLPIGNVFNKFPRMVRDLARRMDKKVELVIHGEETELDRSVIEEINDPIIHMLRNSLDHGIEAVEIRRAANKPETGTITLTARHEQGHIIISIEDDGGGIDADNLRTAAVSKGLMTQEEADGLSDDEAINLIFLSGLSTSKEVTDISGRGVGMDIVRNNIQKINGTITVETKLGVGTSFQIILPLTLAIVPTMLVSIKHTTFALPLVMVAEILRINCREIKSIRKKPVITLRNSVLPLVSLEEVFGYNNEGGKSENLYVVVVYYGKLRLGVIVDRLLGEEEVVVKSLGALIGDVPGISSAAILGDGHVALIVDIPGLLKLSGVH